MISFELGHIKVGAELKEGCELTARDVRYEFGKKSSPKPKISISYFACYKCVDCAVTGIENIVIEDSTFILPLAGAKQEVTAKITDELYGDEICGTPKPEETC